MILFLIIFTIAIAIIIIFSFPQFSPIPYYPSNMKDKKQILKALDLKNNQTVIDLGAGDGVVIFEASQQALKKKLNTQFIALEINPILVCILHIRRFFEPNKKSIQIVWGDMFKINFKQLSTFRPACRQAGFRLSTIYLYISPWLIEKAVLHMKKQFPRASFVSYYYPIKSMKKREKILKGEHPTHIYSLPL